MNKSNLIAEGFFEKLKSILGLDNKKIKTLKKDKKLINIVKKLNNDWDELGDMFAKDYGIKKPKFQKFKVSDFF